MALNASRNDLAAGGMFVAFGGFFALQALGYEFGTPFRMGPGFMPVVLGGILVALGIAVAAKGFGKPDDGEAAPWPWRGIALVLGTIIFFGATIRGLGFVPVVLLAAFATALSSRKNNVVQALIISVGLTFLCYLIFVVGLGMLVPLVGPWLQF
ncbi:Tripartite tricarboxylate transporter TctB family protein [Devosia lucknowensis]|uniref:Tripartite tricarboxylate transporter TctB family protein n=1 Tax=Devosia lucknowensis TaxID=1096929 RepID=A0A1Y6FE27_9HYPH|nr:tripartite tricarboxylate transporter TctB family protein [Devosia lucknowensis]SMQ72889.1 Tripartite tricarboxylate transporter TctB family protein [Devosia lucknowensis]